LECLTEVTFHYAANSLEGLVKCRKVPIMQASVRIYSENPQNLQTWQPPERSSQKNTDSGAL